MSVPRRVIRRGFFVERWRVGVWFRWYFGFGNPKFEFEFRFGFPSLVDRFVCRREGHVPAFEITATSGVTVSSYVTSCQRCGKVIEVQAGAEDSAQPKEARGQSN